MHIIVMGTGYVGLVTGACLAKLGCRVTCIDKDIQKIEGLKKGHIPIYETGLQSVVKHGLRTGHLRFSSECKEELANADVVFIAVGTPTSEGNNGADLSYLLEGVRDIGASITRPCTVIVKSTVPIGTGKKVKALLKSTQPHIMCHVVSNPEFLREGSAVKDFMYPDRIIVGTESEEAQDIMKKLYCHLIDRDVPILFTDVTSSEMIKYASNAFLAVKIAFINEMADMCEKAGGTIEKVAEGMGMDKRIGKRYLKAGPGYGGSCFPKDTRALVFSAQEQEVKLKVVEAAIASNNNRKNKMVDRIQTILGQNLKGKTLACLGLAFKAHTDDMRESPALDIIEGLLARKAIIRAYDPAAQKEAQKLIKGSILFCENSYDALQDADAVIIITEWPVFAEIDLHRLKVTLKNPCVIDLRNLFDPITMKNAGIEYIPLGSKEVI